MTGGNGNGFKEVFERFIGDRAVSPKSAEYNSKVKNTGGAVCSTVILSLRLSSMNKVLAVLRTDLTAAPTLLFSPVAGRSISILL